MSDSPKNTVKPMTKICKFCGKPYIPSKYNHTRQKCCMRPACKAESKKLSNQKYRENNPTYFKKDKDDKTYRTAQYNEQRKQKRRINSIKKRIISEQKRILVATKKEFVSILEYFFKLHLGMVAHSSGGLRQESAYSICNLLNSFYKDGVSILDADANLKQKLEVFNAVFTKSYQPITPEEITKLLHLA